MALNVCFVTSYKKFSVIKRGFYRCLCAHNYADKTTVNLSEVSKFDQLASQWWDLYGELKALHAMNAVRVPLVRDGILRSKTVTLDTINSPKPLTNFTILDVGCGGGLLSEPLARLGANVTGIDPNEGLVEIARRHAEKSDLLGSNSLNYMCQSVENHLVSHKGKYDAVVASEVVEHVDNLPTFIENCLNLTEDGGSLFITTINRTYLSWLFGIVVAENILGLVPRGTHDYQKFVPPNELERILRTAGCHIHLVHGMAYNPLANTWHWIQDTSINYATHAVKVGGK